MKSQHYEQLSLALTAADTSRYAQSVMREAKLLRREGRLGPQEHEDLRTRFNLLWRAGGSNR